MNDKKFVKINIKAGDFTFGQRIELGKIASSDSDELVKSVKIIECLHGFKPNLRRLVLLKNYFEEISSGLLHWVNLEAQMLKYEPTEEEKKAGISELAKKIGEYGTVKALAKSYNQDPDIILGWKYSKVFGILYTDLEEYKYQKKYNTVIEKKYKK